MCHYLYHLAGHVFMMLGVITLTVLIGMLNSERVSYGYTMKWCILLWDLSVLSVDNSKRGVVYTSTSHGLWWRGGCCRNYKPTDLTYDKKVIGRRRDIVLYVLFASLEAHFAGEKRNKVTEIRWKWLSE